MTAKFQNLLVLGLVFFSFGCHAAVNPNPVFIRASQVGYLPGDLKTAVIFSQTPLFEKKFEIVTYPGGKEAFKDEIRDSSFTFDKFKNCYVIDFSKLKKAGKYEIIADGQKSAPFEIGGKVFNRVVDSLMLFFQVQRCGPTNPLLHKVCHLSDATSLVGDSRSAGVDLTGGWHDAGDYVKILSTTAYATYMLIFSYEFDIDKFSFDDNHDGIPDVLAEAKVGLDWLLRCNFEKYKLVTQVQDLRDHSVGWRRPEDDTLRFDRPGFVGIGKNQIGIYCAVMSLASRIWAEKFHNGEFSAQCLAAAENIYSIKDKVQDIENTNSGVYQDRSFLGKLALGAMELYYTTKKDVYLKDAEVFADSANSDYWWSWGDINSLAHYKIAKVNSRYKDYIYNNLSAFNTNKNKSPFMEGMAFTWGSTNSLLGVTLQAILYKDLTHSKEFDSLAIFQRDYILGRNPWGLSFIYNIGKESVRNLHSQIAYFNDGYLPGGLSAGPAPMSVLKDYKINRTDTRYDFFNTDSVKYYDDRNDYITNEPTISGNATAIFVYGCYSNR